MIHVKHDLVRPEWEVDSDDQDQRMVLGPGELEHGMMGYVEALPETDLRFSHSEIEKSNITYVLNRWRSMVVIGGWR